MDQMDQTNVCLKQTNGPNKWTKRSKQMDQKEQTNGPNGPNKWN